MYDLYLVPMNSKKLNTSQVLSNFEIFILWCAVWLHVVNGVLILLIFFPFCQQKSKQSHIQKWSCNLLKIFGIKLNVLNEHILPNRSYLLSSNHISWIDIHAINAIKPMRFVAKHEVRGWPIFGWMAQQLGTVFINRSSTRHAACVVNDMADVLITESICIFPEGTSTDGTRLNPFRSNLFEAAVLTKTPIYSLVIQYIDQKTGLRSEVPAYIGDMGLIESMSAILKHRHLQANLSFLLCSDMTFAVKDRKWLAKRSQEQIADNMTV